MKTIYSEKQKTLLLTILLLFTWLGLCFSASEESAGSEKSPQKMVMTQAVMCESIENFQPKNPAVVFSISQGEVFCFSTFDPVIQKTIIFHKWYKRDKLIFTMPLTLSPPKWSSFSRIQIRDADKGPWRVEIIDSNETLLQTLRFSMVD